MICQNCLKNSASVHVTEIVEITEGADDAQKRTVQEQHLCELCAQTMDLPNMPAVKKSMTEVWKLLQISAQQTRKKGGPVCSNCGMSLEEFRKKGRLGCAKDYEVFVNHIGELLERVHGARTHKGRIPASEPSTAAPTAFDPVGTLRQRLEAAIREEAYESAARLRDEIKALETKGHD
jgi:protein arginine kinase activator